LAERETCPAAGNSGRAANILGALSVLILDRVQARWQEELDLSPMAVAALLQVEWEPGCAIEVVARSIGLSHSATVRIIDKLVERDLLSKDRARQDARVQSVKLTKAGKRMTQQLHAMRNQVTDDLLSLIPSQQVAALQEAVGAILHKAIDTRIEGDVTCRLCDVSRCGLETCPIQTYQLEP